MDWPFSRSMSRAQARPSFIFYSLTNLTLFTYTISARPIRPSALLLSYISTITRNPDFLALSSMPRTFLVNPPPFCLTFAPHFDSVIFRTDYLRYKFECIKAQVRGPIGLLNFPVTHLFVPCESKNFQGLRKRHLNNLFSRHYSLLQNRNSSLFAMIANPLIFSLDLFS